MALYNKTMRAMMDSAGSSAEAGPTNYVGIHPHYDFGLIPNEKNSDLVRIGYSNNDG
jgi:hypothetical protein